MSKTKIITVELTDSQKKKICKGVIEHRINNGFDEAIDYDAVPPKSHGPNSVDAWFVLADKYAKKVDANFKGWIKLKAKEFIDGRGFDL